MVTKIVTIVPEKIEFLLSEMEDPSVRSRLGGRHGLESSLLLNPSSVTGDLWPLCGNTILYLCKLALWILTLKLLGFTE